MKITATIIGPSFNDGRFQKMPKLLNTGFNAYLILAVKPLLSGLRKK